MGLTTHATVIPLRLSTGYSGQVLDALRRPLTNTTGHEYRLRYLTAGQPGDYGQAVLGGAFRKVGVEEVLAHLLDAPWRTTWDTALIVVDDEENTATAQVVDGTVEVLRHNRVDGTALRTRFTVAQWHARQVPAVDWHGTWPDAALVLAGGTDR